jgi:hypothetical protein
MGWLEGSALLYADGLHMFLDVVIVGGIILGNSFHAHSRYSKLLLDLFALVLVGFIGFELLETFLGHGHAGHGHGDIEHGIAFPLLIIGGLRFLVSAVSAFLVSRLGHEDTSLESLYAHLMYDAGVSLIFITVALLGERAHFLEEFGVLIVVVFLVKPLSRVVIDFRRDMKSLFLGQS